MRNLKKVLSLSLALVMLLGMMVMGSAAEYKDAADVNYTEAVEVMSAAGIFNGDNGNFNPAGNLTREQAAKIITYMMMGKDAADKLNAGTAPYTDVAASRWSAGSIAYCATMGITAGNGDGTFSPTANVTGYAFAKMLLTALGYDAKIQGYVNNADWAINVNKDALNAGLLNGLNVSLAANMTREQACQMAFNTMKANLVYHEQKGTEITTGDMTIVIGASAPANVEDTTNLNNSNIYGDLNGTLQFAERYCTDLNLTAGTPDSTFGRPSNAWTYMGEPVGEYALTPDFTYTKGMYGAELNAKVVTKAMKNYSFDTAPFTATVNGQPGATINGVADIVSLTANGVLVEVYADRYNDIYSVVVVDTALARIDNIDAEKKTVDLSELSANGWTFTQVNEDNACIDALLAMNERDYVLVTALDDGAGSFEVASVAAPQVVTGTVTDTSKDYAKGNLSVTIGGTSYPWASAQNVVSTLAIDADKQQNLFLDTYGYAIFAEGVTAAATPDSFYLIEGYRGVNANGKVTDMVKGVLNDGTVISVEVTDASTLTGYSTSVEDATPGVAYTYVVAPTGTYTLSTAAMVSGKGVTTATAGTTTPDTKKNGSYFYADNVKFIYVDLTFGTAKVVEGMPIGQNITTGDYLVVSKDAINNSLVTSVYIAGTYAAANTDLIYVTNTIADITSTNVGTKFGNDGKTTLYGYNVYLNGKDTTVYSASGSVTAGNFYAYNVNEKTGAYELYSYVANVSGSASVAQYGISFVNGRYYVDSTYHAADLFDATNATVVDATGVLGSSVNTMTELKKASDAGSISVALVCDAQAKTVTMIYFLG